MYPFVWQHKIVPILPQSMKEISSAYTPFILGLLSKNVEDWNSIYPDQVDIQKKNLNEVQTSQVGFLINVRLII
jgi:hypothetical protein